MPKDANFTVDEPILQPGESFYVRYRKQPETIYSTFSPNPTLNYWTIPNLEDGCFDFIIQKVKADGSLCPNEKTGTFCVGGETCCTPDVVNAQILTGPGRLQITYSSESCTPAPDSIKVYYKQAGSGGPYIEEAGFVASPIEILTALTEIEGYIVGMCGDVEAEQKPFGAGCATPASVSISYNDTTKNVTVFAPEVGSWHYKIVPASGNCGDTAIAETTSFGDSETLNVPTPGTYKVCLRRSCGGGNFSNFVSSGNFSVSGSGSGSGPLEIDNTFVGIQVTGVSGLTNTIMYPVNGGTADSGTYSSYFGGTVVVLLNSTIGAIAGNVTISYNGVSQATVPFSGSGSMSAYFGSLPNPSGQIITILVQV